MTTEKRFNRVHALCERLRDKPCLRCPASEPMPPYGRCQKMCYGLAKEALNIAMHGNPWGRRGVSKHVKRWRKNFNTERLERSK